MKKLTDKMETMFSWVAHPHNWPQPRDGRQEHGWSRTLEALAKRGLVKYCRSRATLLEWPLFTVIGEVIPLQPPGAAEDLLRRRLKERQEAHPEVEEKWLPLMNQEVRPFIYGDDEIFKTSLTSGDLDEFDWGAGYHLTEEGARVWLEKSGDRIMYALSYVRAYPPPTRGSKLYYRRFLSRERALRAYHEVQVEGVTKMHGIGRHVIRPSKVILCEDCPSEERIHYANRTSY